MSQWNKCWSLHMKINLHLIGAGLKDYMDLFLYCVFTTIFMRNKYIESRPWLLGWTRFLKSRHLHISSFHIDRSTHTSRKEMSPKKHLERFSKSWVLGIGYITLYMQPSNGKFIDIHIPHLKFFAHHAEGKPLPPISWSSIPVHALRLWWPLPSFSTNRWNICNLQRYALKSYKRKGPPLLLYCLTH